MAEQQKLALNVTELAHALGISRNIAYQLCNRADFPSVRIGGRVLIPVRELENWLAEQSEKETA